MRQRMTRAFTIAVMLLLAALLIGLGLYRSAGAPPPG